MQTSSERPPLSRAAAWACLVSNQVVLPGLGSITAGQRRSGYAQAAVATAGAGMVLFWLAWFVWQWVEAKEFPTEFGPYLWVCAVGMVLYFVAWTWALGTSLALLRESSQEAEPPPIVEHPRQQ